VRKRNGDIEGEREERQWRMGNRRENVERGE
jgi:hypothetical protein